MNKLTGYETSRDYARLWELAQEQSVICVVDYKTHYRDVAHTLGPLNRRMEISARGICYIHAKDKAEFLTQCQDSNLEWLVPTKEESA